MEAEGQADIDKIQPSAGDTISGATSQEVHNASEIGRPAQGQTSQELHGGKREKERSGLEGVGASATDESVEAKAKGQGAD